MADRKLLREIRLRRQAAQAQFSAQVRVEQERNAQKPACRFCGSQDVRALRNNGIMGPGHSEGYFACRECGRVTI